MSQQPKQKFSDRQIEEYKAAFSLFDKVTFYLFISSIFLSFDGILKEL